MIVDVVRNLDGGRGTILTNHTSGDTHLTVPKDITGDDVENAHDEGNDSTTDYDLEEARSESGLVLIVRVQVPENHNTVYNHEDAQSDEARLNAQQRPVVLEVALKERKLRDDEECAHKDGDHVADAVEEEVTVDDEGLDKHRD